MNRHTKKVSGIILAAGTGSRMGRIKQLLPFGRTNILGEVVNNARRSMLYEIIVVLGYRAGEIKNAIDLNGINVVVNTDYLQGQSSSIIKGIENISSDCDAAMFLLGDQPLINFSAINFLIKSFESYAYPIVIPYFNDRRGNPVIISRSLFNVLKSLSRDTGARVIFHEFKELILKVPFDDESILVDIDTEDDYRKLMSE